MPPEEVVELRALRMVSPPNTEIIDDKIESYVNQFSSSSDGGGRRFDVIFLASMLDRMVTNKVHVETRRMESVMRPLDRVVFGKRVFGEGS